MIDTNVPATANGKNAGAPPSCAAASAAALRDVMRSGHVFIDDGNRIVAEYRAQLSARGEPGPGDRFLRWILDHQYGGRRVTRVKITPVPGLDGEFAELPAAPRGVRYDPSDRKFLAVAAAHAEHPPILQAFDSKWWGWQRALARHAIRIHFLCEQAIERKHRSKIKSQARRD